MVEQEVYIKTDYIPLASLLKWANIVATGGEAKNLIINDLVAVNGDIIRQKAKKIYPGDKVAVGDDVLLIVKK